MKLRTLAFWLTVAGAVAVWAFVAPVAAGGSKTAQAAAERYVHAARDGRYERLADMLSRESLEYYQLLIDAALYLDEEHLRFKPKLGGNDGLSVDELCLGLWDRLVILFLRSRHSADDLQAMTPEEAFSDLYRSDWLSFLTSRGHRLENSRLPERPRTDTPLKLLLEDDTAYFYGKNGRIYGQNPENPRHDKLFAIKFHEENGSWNLDLGVHIFMLNFYASFILVPSKLWPETFDGVVTEFYAPEGVLPVPIGQLNWKPLAQAKPEQALRCVRWLEEFDPRKHGM